jgi:hypothetical protein
MKLFLAITILLLLVGAGLIGFVLISLKFAEKNIEWCGRLPTSMKAGYYSSNKSLIRDPELCKYISQQFWRDNCVWSVAARLNDTMVCSKIDDATENYLCRMKFGFIGGYCTSDSGCKNNALCIDNVCH